MFWQSVYMQYTFIGAVKIVWTQTLQYIVTYENGMYLDM